MCRPMSSIFTITPTTPYTAIVMAIATKARTPASSQIDVAARLFTSFSAIAMISADKMKSVRTAPFTIFCSCSLLVNSASSSTKLSSSCGTSFSQTFSAPSKHRYAPPNMRIGVIAHGRNRLSNNATGKMMTSLLKNEPLAMRQIIGSSRSGVNPVTYCGVTAVSSMTTPAALLPALPAAAATSSTDAAATLAIVAMSSSKAARPDGMWTNSLMW